MIGIMVVDDEEGVRRSLRKVLEEDGYTIFLAENGEQAIEMVQHCRDEIETVISDFRMPGLDGLETLIQIGYINPEITRIMLTGYATMESAIEAVNAGIDGFLTKPFVNTELRAKVREYTLKKRLKQFVSERVLEELQKEARRILPERREVTVLFADIRNFTAMVEKMTPDELVSFLNRFYFGPLDHIVHDCQGTLDKHIGDSIMAVFGAPESCGDDAWQAVLCAWRMQEEVRRINEELAADGMCLAVGIGIGSGEVLAGIFGSARKKEYTVFGMPVNIASRLERLAAAGEILLCGASYQQVQHRLRVKKLDPVTIRGVRQQIELFRVEGLVNSLPAS